MGLIGNVFLDRKIDEVIALGKQIDAYNQILQRPELISFNQFYIGVDSGFGTTV